MQTVALYGTLGTMKKEQDPYGIKRRMRDLQLSRKDLQAAVDTSENTLNRAIGTTKASTVRASILSHLDRLEAERGFRDADVEIKEEGSTTMIIVRYQGETYNVSLHDVAREEVAVRAAQFATEIRRRHTNGATV